MTGMKTATDPALLVGSLALVALAIGLFWRLIVWIRDAPVRPDPWETDVAQQVAAPEAVEVCPHCLTEQSATGYFCEKCGAATGPYNNLMPDVNVFSMGEVLRNGTSGKFPVNALTLAGFVLYPLLQCLPIFFVVFFATSVNFPALAFFLVLPGYLFLLVRNVRRNLKQLRTDTVPPVEPVEISR